MTGASILPDRKATFQYALSMVGLVLVVGRFLARSIPAIVAGGFATLASVVVFVALLLRAVPARVPRAGGVMGPAVRTTEAARRLLSPSKCCTKDNSAGGRCSASRVASSDVELMRRVATVPGLGGPQ